MSIKKIALTAITAAALVAPTLGAANAHHINKKPAQTVDNYDDYANDYDRKRSVRKNNKFDDYDNYDDYVAAKQRKLHKVSRGNVNTPGINRRMERQRDRIRAGRKNGELTWNEARKLRKGVRRVRRALNRARYDGNVTRIERRELRDMLDQNGKRIRRLRNNDRHASRHTRKFRKYIDLSF